MTQKDIQLENEELKKELMKVTSEAEHLKRQVKMAVNLRYHLMPNNFPIFPDLTEIVIYADQISMADVGGDFFDIFRIDDDHIGLLVADIFDGGDAAALFMVAFKIYLSGELYMGFPIEKLMEIVNTRLVRSNEDNLSLSAWYGIYEISTGNIRAVNACHEAPIIRRKSGADICPEDEVSFIMGIFEGMNYTSYETHLEPGEELVIYTDGFLKAQNDNGDKYTVENIKNILNQCGDASAEETVAAVQKDLIGFTKGTPLVDDATMLCIKRNGGA